MANIVSMKAIVLTLALFTVVSGTVLSQSSDIEEAVKAKSFTIRVESMSPRRGGFRQLTTLYTFIVRPDTVTADLPYVGRAYQAPMGTSDSGVKFLSRDFEYKAEPRKKGSWEITLRLKDETNYPLINITLQPNGSASIRISPVDREFISYMGRVVAREP